MSIHDAPAYCMICDRPIQVGPTCRHCELAGLDDDDEGDGLSGVDAHLEAAYEERFEIDD